MRKIQIKRGVKQASRKTALDIGDIAPVGKDNFETLTTPPFKAKLELIEAEPHTPPTMNAQTDQNIKTDGEDPNRPSAKDLVKKKPEYDNSNAVEVHEVPHEGERVKQANANNDALLAQMKAEFSKKFALASTLFDIKTAAGIEDEINRNNFVHSMADNQNVTLAQLEQQVNDGQAFLNQMTQGQQKVASTGFPAPSLNNPRPAQKQSNMLGDDLEIAIMGSF